MLEKLSFGMVYPRLCGANDAALTMLASFCGRPPRGRWNGEKTPEAPDYFTPEETSALVAANPIYPVRMALSAWAGVGMPVPLPRGPANHQPEAGGDGEQGETGPRGPHPRRLGGVPGGSGVVSRAKDGERPLIDRAVAGNSPVYGPGWEFPLVVAQGVAGKPGLFLPGRTVYFCPFQPGVSRMTLYGYARVSVREPEDKNLDLQVERLVRAGCSLGNSTHQ